MLKIEAKDSNNKVDNLEHVEPEIWKDVEEFDGWYQVSNHGRVRSWKPKSPLSKRRKKPYYLSQETMNNGYKRVSMSKDGEKTRVTVHRLVGIHFVDNTENKPHINHKDSDKTNNFDTNIEWCTHSENMKHSWDNGNRTSPCKKGEKHMNAKLTRDNVIDIKKRLLAGEETQKEIATDYDICPSVISCINTGKYWSHIKL